MVLKSFDLTIADLPKELEIEMSANASPSDIDEMIESLRGQVLYNSRVLEQEGAEDSLAAPVVQILEQHGDRVKLRIATA